MIGILGGGLSGVALQRFLRCESEILEKEDRIGGLCRTFRKEGFSYDIGGHILYSKEARLKRLFRSVMGRNIISHRRNNKVLFKGRYVKYPFENDLGSLDKEDTYECLIGYLKNKYRKGRNFKEWIYHTFGDGIARKYLIPYNTKLWKMPLDKMSLEWVERVPKPPLEDVVKSAVGISTEGYTHQLYFDYPARGGIEAFVKALRKKGAEVTTRFTVKEIAREKGAWRVSDGMRTRRYGKIIMAMPLQEISRSFIGMPRSVEDAIKGLRYNSARIVMIGVKNGSLLDKSAVYIPDKAVLPHRVCFMGYFSKDNAPKGMSSLIAEVSTRKGRGFYNMSASNLTEKVIRDLAKAGIIEKKDVSVTDVADIEYGYVVCDEKYAKNVKTVRAYFSSIGVDLLGRFAEFEYINMDEVLRRSMRLAAKLNKGRPR